jgi:transposase
MNEASSSAGIDVDSTWLDLGFHPFAKPIRARNSDAGIETIIAALRERGAGKVALEAIGGYARKMVAALIEADFRVFLVNPRRIKAFRDAEGLIAKTDKLDAGLIARFAHAMAHELRPLPDAEQAILKALSTRRRQLTESIAIEKARLKQAFDPLIVESCREMIALLEDKRRAIEEDLDRRIDAQDGMARRRAILTSIPGVGARISALVVVEMPELGAIDRKAAASLAGLAPIPRNLGFPAGATPSPGVDPACGRPSTWPRSSQRAAIRNSSKPISTCAPLENRPRSPSSPSHGASSPSPMPPSATTFPSTTPPSLDKPNTVARNVGRDLGFPLGETSAKQ